MRLEPFAMRLRLAINVIWKATSEAVILSPSRASADSVFYKLLELGHMNPSNKGTRGLELIPSTMSEAEESIF